jgi:hypothetical protein
MNMVASHSTLTVKEVSRYWYGGMEFTHFGNSKPKIDNEFMEAFTSLNNNLVKGSPTKILDCKNYKMNFKGTCLGITFRDFVEDKKISVDPVLQHFLQTKTKNYTYVDSSNVFTFGYSEIRCQLTSPVTDNPLDNPTHNFMSKEKIKVINLTLPEQFNIIRCNDFKNTLFGNKVNVVYTFLNEFLVEINIKLSSEENKKNSGKIDLDILSANEIYTKIFNEENLQSNEIIEKKSYDKKSITWIDSNSDSAFYLVDDSTINYAFLYLIYRKFKATQILNEIQKDYLKQESIKLKNINKTDR